MSSTGDPRHPPGVEIPSLYRVVLDATPGDIPSKDLFALLHTEAHPAIVNEGRWTGPNGTTYEAVMDTRTGTMVCGYRKLRSGDWFVRDEDGELDGPFRTKRAALYHIGAKKGSYVDTGHYQANGHDILTRENL